MPETLSTRALNRATLARQGLLERWDVDAVEAVERLAGMQAQEPRHPFLGLWTRLEGFERDDLAQALRERKVVRATWARATLHLVSAQDFAASRASLAPVMERAMGAIGDRSEGLDLDATLAAARKLLEKRPYTFDDLRTALQKRFPEVNERALGYATRLHLPLVMVPTDDRWAFPRVAEFALVDAELKPKLKKDRSPKDLVLSYLAAFGPATAADVQTWSGLPKLKPLLADLEDQLALFQDEKGRQLFDLSDAPRPEEETAAPPRLLPDFDNLMLAHDDRSRIIATQHRSKVTTKNLRVRATFLLDGVAAGTWTIKATKKKATVTLEPFGRLPARDRKALEAEAEALARFAEPDLAAYDVAVG